MAKEDNLTPFTKENAAIMGARGGAAGAGTRHLKTIIQEIGHNIDWDKTTLKDKDSMKARYGNNAWNALTYVAFTKAMAGDPKAMDWLSKNGYGTNIDVTTDGQALQPLLVRFIGSEDVTKE